MSLFHVLHRGPFLVTETTEYNGALGADDKNYGLRSQNTERTARPVRPVFSRRLLHGALVSLLRCVLVKSTTTNRLTPELK